MTDLFFQPSDQARMQACVSGLALEGLCVAVHCSQVALLNYYGQIFTRQLREAMPNVAIESYSSSDADVLIENFNQTVSGMSVQEALNPGDLSDVRKVWIIKNAHNMESHALELLGQLLQQFPGSKVRFVLWMAGAEPNATLLNALGKKLMRWNIALPNSAQTQSFWNQARASEQEEDVRQMLDQLRLLEHVPAALRAARDPKLMKAKAKDKGKTQKKKNAKLSLPKLGVGFLLVLALMMGSTALVAWLQPDAFEWLQLNAESSSSQQNNPGELPQIVVADTKNEPRLTEPDQTPLPIQTDASTLELPDEALAGKQWAEQLPGQTWLVLHGAYKSLAIAQQVKKAYPGLKNSRVVSVYRPNEPLAAFVLASGPFETLPLAEEFTKLSTLPNPGTVRTERNLKSRLNPTQEPRTKP